MLTGNDGEPVDRTLPEPEERDPDAADDRAKQEGLPGGHLRPVFQAIREAFEVRNPLGGVRAAGTQEHIASQRRRGNTERLPAAHI